MGKEPRHQCPFEITVFHACSVSQYISNLIQLKYPVDTTLEKDKFDHDLSEPWGWGWFGEAIKATMVFIEDEDNLPH